MSKDAINLQEYSVSELSQALKLTVENSFSYVRVRGELSGFKRAPSGHLYMSLKDDKAVMDAVCWRGAAGRLAFQPEDGLEVICSGKLTTYPARSKYQLVVEHMEPAGAGALMALLEERKKKLAAEGLFAGDRKKPLPFLPSVIGVVTSPTGAVIKDILHRLSDRFPRHVLLWPVQVQGERSAQHIVAAIRGFNALEPGGPFPRPDLLIVARGGGSLEDLWSFNEEEVVRAAAESDIPLISAVGHETDTTLIDYASDLRAPTPTAAAEFAVPVLADLKFSLADFEKRMTQGRHRLFERLDERLKGLSRALPSPRDLLGLAQQRMDELAARLPRGLTGVAQNMSVRFGQIAGGLSAGILRQRLVYAGERIGTISDRMPLAAMSRLGSRRDQFQSLSRIFESMSHRKVLERGFAVVYDAGGTPVTEVAMLNSGDQIGIELKDGHLPAVVDGVGAPHRAAIKKPKSRTSVRSGDNKQGKLL